MAFIPIYDTNPLRNIKRPYVAWAIIAINVVVFFVFERGYTGEASEASVITFGLVPALFTGTIEIGDDLPGWVTIVTSAFLHGDIWHLFGNMIFLWVLADNVEDALGHVRYFIFYMLCAIAAGLAVVAADPASQNPVIGASGAVAGVIAAYLILTPRAKIWALLFGRIPIRVSAYWVLGSWLILQIISVMSDDDEGIAWWAHIGGFAAGAVLVVFMRRRGVRLFGEVVPSPVPAPTGTPPVAVPAADTPPEVAKPRGPWG